MLLLQIIEHEEMPDHALKKAHFGIINQIGRTVVILACTSISSKVHSTFSLVRIGVYLEDVSGDSAGPVDEMFISSHPAHVQKGGCGGTDCRSNVTFRWRS